MTPEEKTQHEAAYIAEEFTDALELFKSKNIAYGDSFGKQFQNYGAISALVRMSDKFTRIESLILGAKNDVHDERLADTLTDLAMYCFMLSYELNEEERRNLNDGTITI
jgi:hypothetical protein